MRESGSSASRELRRTIDLATSVSNSLQRRCAESQRTRRLRCGDCCATDGFYNSSFAVKFLSRISFSTFVCFEQGLVIEIDGSQHALSERDSVRDLLLSAEGFQIARYWNNDVLQQRTAVLEDILTKLTISN